MERTNVFLEFDLNEYSVLVALLVNGKDFCGDWSHLRHFLRLTSPEIGNALKELQARTGTGGGESWGHSRLSSTKSSVIAAQGCPRAGEFGATFVGRIAKNFGSARMRIRPAQKLDLPERQRNAFDEAAATMEK